MNEKNTKYLLAKFPDLYRQYHLPMEQSCMCFGFDCGDGWFKIIQNLSKKLNVYAIKKKISIQATQVKEKYGDLRYYLNYEDNVISGYVRHASKLSETTCELCGKPGTLLGGKWFKVRCEECKDK